MAANRGSYPHPVLDWADDVASDFEISNLTIAPSVEDIEIRFEVRTDDPTLASLIASGAARYSFRWKCGATLATGDLDPEVDATTAAGTRFVGWLDQREVRRTVTLDLRVVAAKDIPAHRWERQHPEYGDATFDLRIGDLLADGGQISFEAEKLYDPLDPPVGSCFRFVGDPTVKRGVSISFNDDEFVRVRFPEKDLPGLAAMASRPELQISTVVLPALMETINFIATAQSEATAEPLDDKLWARTIIGLVERFGGFEQSAFTIAQQILEHPINKTLATVLATEEDE